MTAQKVIEMFAELGLRVCDDGPAINAAFAQKSKRYLKMANTAGEWQQGQRLISEGNMLVKDHSDLVSLVFEEYRVTADAAVHASIANGLVEVTPQLEEALLEIARKRYCTEERLAQDFLGRYMQLNQLKRGLAAFEPEALTSFQAASGFGEITLRWSLPSKNCDQVEIVREAEPTATGQGPGAVTVYRGSDSSFRDSGVVAGTRYTYRVHAVYQGRKGIAGLSTRAVCLGEVGRARAVFNAGVIELGWELLGRGSSVIVFRRRGSPPVLRTGLDGAPVPGDDQTRQVYRGADGQWRDADLAEGVTHHYRIVTHFGGQLYSRGTDVEATVRRAPPPPPSGRAQYGRGSGKDSVLLEWAAVPDRSLEYLLVRRPGSVPPDRLENGHLLFCGIHQTSYLDDSVVAGHRYSYAVFSRSGGLVSRVGAPLGTVDVLAEVSALNVHATSNTIELSWKRPSNAVDVVVRRSLGEVSGPKDGAVVPLVGIEHARDQALRNGQLYHYLICCVYRPDGASEVISPGLRLTARPEDSPEAVADFRVAAAQSSVVCQWTEPTRGRVVVLRSARRLDETTDDVRIGRAVALARLNGLGERVPAAGSGTAVDPAPTRARPWYAAFTVSGSEAVFAGSLPCVLCADVSDLTATCTPDGVLLRWAWPTGCTRVRVLRRADAFPAGPGDPRARIFTVSRTQYGESGDRFVDDVGEEGGRMRYVVFAQEAGFTDAPVFSPGTAEDCRLTVEWTPWSLLVYRLVPRGKSLALNWAIEKVSGDFKGFALVVNQSRVPESLDDGQVLFQSTASDIEVGEHTCELDCEPIERRRWVRFFYKVQLLDGVQNRSTLIVHPNTSVPFDASGLRRATPRNGVVLAPGVPEQVTCPSCFEEFPVGKIRFTTSEGGDPVPARYTPLDRLRGRPPQPPKSPDGRHYNRKVCPQGDTLPFTAGVQKSLVIGLIGAKYSGKSHYIASLIRRLEGNVGHNMEAGLLAVSDETQERYRREFFEPLFGKRLELDRTAGEPPPLIYDLTFGGQLWGEEQSRSVTLALYDTAGESFDRQETVERMARYLRVASGIILLLDPLQTRAVRDALPPSIQTPDLDDLAEPNAILSRVVQVLQSNPGAAPSGPLSTPIAVVLTKCDVLGDAGLIERNRLWHTGRSHVRCFDDQVNDDLTGMMAEYTQRWSPAAYHSVLQRFSRYAFFGVSATGCAPDPTTRRYRFISPWRVEDPLLWLLAELGVIPRRSPPR